MPLELWAPWRAGGDGRAGLQEVDRALISMLKPNVVLDIAQNFTAFATDRRRQKIKLICRYQQFEAANQIVQRVVEGKIRKGLIWHFQGSGKSLLMVFAANKLRLHPELGNPTVLIVVDRIDLDTQITGTFNASDVKNLVAAETRSELQDYLTRDSRKIIITTIHKFGEVDGVLNPRDNIVVLVDEAHRTQEGDLGRKMRDALPNAFLFGLTGTPVNTRDRNTFYAFGAAEDNGGYLSRYSFEESIRDEATLPLRFETRSVDMRIDRQTLDQNMSSTLPAIVSEIFRILKPSGKYLGMNFSDCHPAVTFGKALGNGDYAEFTSGPFKNIGARHFFNEIELRDLFRQFAILDLKRLSMKSLIHKDLGSEEFVLIAQKNY